MGGGWGERDDGVSEVDGLRSEGGVGEEYGVSREDSGEEGGWTVGGGLGEDGVRGWGVDGGWCEGRIG